jgi:hypothetical protein
MDTSNISSERGKEVLIVESAKFTKDKVLKSGETYWRCAIGTYVPAKQSFLTMGVENTISRSDFQHNH